MDNINEICKQRMDRLGLNFHTIAKHTGLSESTVRNFLTEKSKQPSIYTAGPICSALQISLDEYFHINTKAERPASENQLLIHDLNMEIIRVKELNGVLQARIKTLRSLSGGLLVLCLLLAAAAVLYLAI